MVYVTLAVPEVKVTVVLRLEPVVAVKESVIELPDTPVVRSSEIQLELLPGVAVQDAPLV